MTYSFTCHSDRSGNHQCSVLTFENVTIMMDPAWNGSNVGYDDAMEFWAQLIAQTDIVLLCQPIPESLGAYAALYTKFLAHFQSRIAVYATLPVTNLGRVTTLDLYASQGVIGPVESNRMDLGDIEEAFDHVITVKYSQILDLKSKFEGITLVPYNSGYAPGGSIFCITTYSDKVIYAPRWNHTKDTILNSAGVLDILGKPVSSLMRPSAIVTTTSHLGPTLPYRKRASNFKDLLREVISKNGTALIPSQIGGKFLDLLVLVNDMLYEQRRYRNQSDIPVLLVSYSRGRTLTYAKSMLEWLSSAVVKTWEARNNRSPFDLGSRFAIVSPEELRKFQGAKICFVSQVDTLINDTVVALGQSDKTTVIFTEPCTVSGGSNNLLSTMYAKWEKAMNGKGKKAADGRPVTFGEAASLQLFKLDQLKNKDLEEYEKKIQNRRSEHTDLLLKLQKESTVVDSASTVPGMLDINTAEDDDDDDVPDFITAAGRKADAVSKPVEIPIDIYVNPEAPARLKMFPFQPLKVKHDDYGDVVDFSQFIPKDQLVEAEKRSSADAYDEEEDPYELEVSSRSTKKRRGGGSERKNNSKKEENMDDASYLDALNKPYRRIASDAHINLKCLVAVVDLSSLVDQRSMSVIWPSLKPRNLLLMAPKESQNSVATKTLRSKLLDVIDLEFNATVSFETVIKSLDVSVDPELDQRLKWQSISDGYTIAHVVGRLVRESVIPTEVKQQHRDKWVLKPLINGSRLYPKISLSIGDVKLAELKRRLTHQNHVAEFKGEGSLVIDGKVVVRKISDGETVVDGAPSELFYKVKAAVADMLAKTITIHEITFLINKFENSAALYNSISRSVNFENLEYMLDHEARTRGRSNTVSDGLWGVSERGGRSNFQNTLPTRVTGALSQEQIVAYQVMFRIQEITTKLRLNVVNPPARRSRSPSPPPVYDARGKRTNTREQRYKRQLEDERHRLVEIALKMIPHFVAPDDYKRPTKFQDKYYIPIQRYPEINFMGLLLGPRGNTLRKLQEDSGCKIAIRGQGSVKEGKNASELPKGAMNFEEPLHCIISAESEDKIQKGVKACEGVVIRAVTSPEGQNELKRGQLRELAELNGTLREDSRPCPTCGLRGHRRFECPNRSTFVQQIICQKCGQAGHATRDCTFDELEVIPQKEFTSPAMLYQRNAESITKRPHIQDEEVLKNDWKRRNTSYSADYKPSHETVPQTTSYRSRQLRDSGPSEDSEMNYASSMPYNGPPGLDNFTPSYEASSSGTNNIINGVAVLENEGHQFKRTSQGGSEPIASAIHGPPGTSISTAYVPGPPGASTGVSVTGPPGISIGSSDAATSLGGPSEYHKPSHDPASPTNYQPMPNGPPGLSTMPTINAPPGLDAPPFAADEKKSQEPYRPLAGPPGLSGPPPGL